MITKKELKQDLINIRNGALITPFLEKICHELDEMEDNKEKLENELKEIRDYERRNNNNF